MLLLFEGVIKEKQADSILLLLEKATREKPAGNTLLLLEKAIREKLASSMREKLLNNILLLFGKNNQGETNK